MLKAAKTSDDVIGIAKEHGYELTSEHLTQLSEEELERVAGGGVLGAFLFTCGLTLLADGGEGE